MNPSAADFAALQKKVDYLMDRSAIMDCVSRYARGVDRHDAEMILSAYHPDGFDVHGHAVNDMKTFAEWANALHSESFSRHVHCLTTHNCEIDGDTAHAESYVLYGLLRPDGESVWFGAGRYIDRLEKRDGQWKILVRKTTIEWMVNADTSPMKTKYFLDQGYPSGKMDRTDLAYQRPLELPTQAEHKADHK